MSKREDPRMNFWEFLDENMLLVIVGVLALFHYLPVIIKAFKN